MGPVSGARFAPSPAKGTCGLARPSPGSFDAGGTPRGFGEAEFRAIGDWIVEVVDGLAANGEDGNAGVEAAVRAKVQALCDRFPIYPDF